MPPTLSVTPQLPTNASPKAASSASSCWLHKNDSHYDVFVKGRFLHFRRPRELFIEGLLGPQRRLLVYVALAGVVGALVGAAYIGLLHLFQNGLWPTHWDTLPHLFILVGVGIAVGVLTRILGNPGDVELLVNN